MQTIKEWLSNKLFWLKTGVQIVEANNGKPIDQIVIRHGNYWFMVDMDAESGEPTGGFGWSEGTPMTPVPIREHYEAVRGPHCNTGCRTAKCTRNN